MPRVFLDFPSSPMFHLFSEQKRLRQASLTNTRVSYLRPSITVTLLLDNAISFYLRL